MEKPKMEYPEVVKYFRTEQKTRPERYQFIRRNVKKALAAIGIGDYVDALRDKAKCK